MSNKAQLDTTREPVKAQSNATKHGVTFVQAATLVRLPAKAILYARRVAHQLPGH